MITDNYTIMYVHILVIRFIYIFTKCIKLLADYNILQILYKRKKNFFYYTKITILKLQISDISPHQFNRTFLAEILDFP